ncbi:GNAT family N-acetyltransferase [Methanolobus psychrotolerans]|uniref:GNAT family N-acetyltransferase n=1 Tax=Methanolobus psychrotolerans TaxID=1874706 RepID=UPI00101AE401|nr:GNAT family N-acetyltransferase [Methanolobus psychrotolerans]
MSLKRFTKSVLTGECLSLIEGFDCGCSQHTDFEKLNLFLKEKALEYNQDNFSRTNIFHEDGECAAYYSLSMNAINGKKIDVDDQYRSLKSYPALFLTRFAVDKKYQRSGIGRGIINDIIKNAYRDGEVAARFLYVDASPMSVSWYLGNPLFTVLYSELTERIEQCIESYVIEKLNMRLVGGHCIEFVLDGEGELESLKKNCEKILTAHVKDIFNELCETITIFSDCNSKIKLNFENNKPKIVLDNFNTRQNHGNIRDWLKQADNVLNLDITIPLYLDMKKHYMALYGC